MTFFTKADFEEFSIVQDILEQQYKPDKKYNRQSSERNLESDDRNQGQGRSGYQKNLYSRTFLSADNNSPASWYRHIDTKYSSYLKGFLYHEKKTTQIGKPTHEQYVKLFSSSNSDDAKRRREELNRILPIVSPEQHTCMKLYEKLAHTTRKKQYQSFAITVPPVFKRILKSRVIDAVSSLPTVFVKENEFDCAQMVFKSMDVMSFEPQKVLKVPEDIRPHCEKEPILCEETFAGCPLVLDKPNLFQFSFRKLEQNSISSEGVWANLTDSSNRSFLDDYDFKTKHDPVCLIDLDTLCLLASGSFVHDLDLTLSFRKEVHSKLSNPVLTFKPNHFHLHGYPPRVHCSDALKILLEDRFGSIVDSSLEKDSTSENADSNDSTFLKRTSFEFVTAHSLTGMQSNIVFIVGVKNPIMYSTVPSPAVSNPNSSSADDVMNFDKNVFYVFKREMQCEFGLEELHIDEIVRIVLILHLYPQSKVVLVRVDSECKCIIDVSDYAVGNERLCNLIMKRNFNVQSCLHKLSQIVMKLSKLEINGQYLLRRNSFSTKFEIFIQSNLSNAPDLSQRAAINLGLIFSHNELSPFENEAWMPIDTTRITPFHWHLKKIPCSFPHQLPPKEGGNSTSGKRQNTQSPTSKKKKFNKRGAGKGWKQTKPL